MLKTKNIANIYRVFQAWLRQAPYISIVVVLAAAAMADQLSVQVRAVAGNMSSANAAELDSLVKLEKVPASDAEYTQAIKFCMNHTPGVSCALTSGKFVVSIDNAEKYEDWMFALASIQSYGKDIVWEPKLICIGQCSGAAASAELIAYSQKIVFQSK
jgi:hypothetical protein